MVKTIMVVDDNSDVAYSVKLGLEGLDPEYSVTCVNGGQECFKLLEENKIPDILLLDLMMPEMNGWEVQKKMQEKLEWKDIPVVFFTAVVDETSKLTGRILGKDFIEKPFDIVDLKQRIDKVLKNLEKN